MKITYTSVDGKNFETEDECRSHEAFLSEKNDLILKGIHRHLLKDESKETFKEKARQLKEVFPLIEQVIKASQGEDCLKEVVNIIRLFCMLKESVSERNELLELDEAIEDNGGIFFYYGD